MIFLEASDLNRITLINEDEVLYKLRHKLKSMCVTAKKASYTK
jgi:hypothetical protein